MSDARVGSNGSVAELLWPSRPTPLFESADADTYGDLRPPPSPSGTRRPRVRTGTALTLMAFVVLYGAAVLLHRYDEAIEPEQPSTSKAVQGRVTVGGTSQAPTPTQGTTTAQSARTRQDSLPAQAPSTAQSSAVTAAAAPTTGAVPASPATVAPSSPSARPSAPFSDRTTDGQVASASPAAGSELASPPAPASQRAQSSPSHSQTAKASSSGATASAKGYGERNRRLMSLALARARTGLNANDLRTARSGVFWALSLQPDNSEALTLKQELLSRERAERVRR